MPTYLCHGFRWYRRNIRIFVILNDLDECAPDWIVDRTTASFILSQFAESFDFVPRLDDEQQQRRPGEEQQPHEREEEGELEEETGDSDTSTPTQEKRPPLCYDDELSMQPSKVPPDRDHVLAHDWSPVKLLEEHDEQETEHATRPFAYVADHVVRVDLGADVAAEMAKYDESRKKRESTWFEKLREQVQPEEQSRWYVVVCQDPDREPIESDSDTDAESTETDEEPAPHHPNYISTAHERPVSVERKGLPPLPLLRDKGKDSASQPPSFLDQDPYAAEQSLPAPRLKKKLSIRRLFSKKEA
ncbi:hypothetical protein AAL_06400 [Moelleriella libera RCEF 2490]|uniref:Developmental regulator n=1 Tax=Moelleriella libera RCEF 2490 TaxID=1081109 RepID=A0A166NT02_9HYPO|nr:hypothetical protein AAL_06400 [Moelleriella libera RCEF 2490]